MQMLRRPLAVRVSGRSLSERVRAQRSAAHVDARVVDVALVHLGRHVRDAARAVGHRLVQKRRQAEIAHLPQNTRIQAPPPPPPPRQCD
eukprot:6208281-Pleurochrysis_carterae.AAC.5